MTHNLCFEHKKKSTENCKFLQLARRNLYILLGHVFVMTSSACLFFFNFCCFDWDVKQEIKQTNKNSYRVLCQDSI